MSSRYSLRSALTLILVSFLIPQVLAQCNTDQNPSCAGNSAFELLCCPYPAVCYYADRYGGVACCQPGQKCYENGDTVTPTLIPVSTLATTQTIQTVQPTQTIQTTQAVQTTQNGGYSTITVTGGIAATTVATAIGYTTTAGVVVPNDASRAIGNIYTTQFSLGLMLLAWILT